MSGTRIESLYSINFTDHATGHVVGTGGTILKTTNGGGTGLNDGFVITKLLTTYPNPVKEKFSIKSSFLTGDIHLSIFNIRGQELIERKINSQNTQIDISTLPAGIYFVRLKNEQTVEVGKIIKE